MEINPRRSRWCNVSMGFTSNEHICQCFNKSTESTISRNQPFPYLLICLESTYVPSFPLLSPSKRSAKRKSPTTFKSLLRNTTKSSQFQHEFRQQIYTSKTFCTSSNNQNVWSSISAARGDCTYCVSTLSRCFCSASRVPFFFKLPHKGNSSTVSYY